MSRIIWSTIGYDLLWLTTDFDDKYFIPLGVVLIDTMAPFEKYILLGVLFVISIFFKSRVGVCVTSGI